MHLHGLAGLPSGQPSTKRREEVTDMPTEFFDADAKKRISISWRRVFGAIQELVQSLSDILKSLYDAVVKAQSVRKLNRAHWRRPKTRGFVPVTCLYIRPHAAYVRFHVAATGD